MTTPLADRFQESFDDYCQRNWTLDGLWKSSLRKVPNDSRH